MKPSIVLVISSYSRSQFPDCLLCIVYTISRKLPKPSHRSKDILGRLLRGRRYMTGCHSFVRCLMPNPYINKVWDPWQTGTICAEDPIGQLTARSSHFQFKSLRFTRGDRRLRNAATGMQDRARPSAQCAVTASDWTERASTRPGPVSSRCTTQIENQSRPTLEHLQPDKVQGACI